MVLSAGKFDKATTKIPQKNKKRLLRRCQMLEDGMGTLSTARSTGVEPTHCTKQPKIKIPWRNRVIKFYVMIQWWRSWYFGWLISLVHATPLLHIQINLGRLLVVVILRRDQLKSFLTVLPHLNLFETGPDTSRNADYDAHFHNRASINDELNHFLHAYRFIYTQRPHTSLSCGLVVEIKVHLNAYPAQCSIYIVIS